MPSINAVSIAPAARDWLAHVEQARVLHVFDRGCNLIDERGEVLSAVAAGIGNGPFNLVIQEDVWFSDHLDAQSAISIWDNQLNFGDLSVRIDNANPWCPRPDWETLHTQRDIVLGQLMSVPIPDGYAPLPDPLVSALSISICNADRPAALAAARRLAGLGAGLTPAGDDFLLGASLAAWIIHPPDIARVLAAGIASAAAPLTTSLSAAWLKSAGRGEAGNSWHEFLCALISADRAAIQNSAGEILAIGHTSGADALAGFLGTLERCTALADSRIP